MNAIETLLTNPISEAVGWALIHFVWQGALIAVLYFIASLMLRRFSSRARYAAACLAMLLMLAAPLVTLFARSGSPGGQADLTADTVAEVTSITSARAADDRSSVARSGSATVASLDPAPFGQRAAELLPRFIPWLLALWLVGVLFLSLRFAGGLLMVRRLRRAEKSAAIGLWEERLSRLRLRLRLSRPVRLLESALVEVPTVIGWLRPVILIPATALTGLSAEQLEALLAHELAHIRRHDYLVNLLQTAVETLLFYHPAVWWVSAQVRQEREHCCDDLAVAACGDVLTYARALTALEQMRVSSAQLAVAATGGSLLARIQRLIRGRAPALYGMESWFAVSISLATIVVLLAGAHSSFLSRHAQAAANDPTRLTFSESSNAQASRAMGEARKKIDKPDQASEPAPAGEAVTEPPSVNADAAQTPDQEPTPADSRDFISEMASAGLNKLDADDLIALKTYGVTPEFIREMSALVSHKLTAEDVVGMKIHGVTAAFATAMKALGLRSMKAEELVAFRIHGVTTEFINEIKNTGVRTLDPDTLVALRIHGVTPAFVQQTRDLGFPNMSAEELIAFRIHDVSPLFIQTMRTYIRGNISAEELVALRIHGVRPEMIKELEIMGIANLSAEDLTNFRIHGVTTAFIKSVHEAGFPKATADELIHLRISGVTPDFIQLVRSRGFANVTLDQLVELRRLNIVPSGKKAN